MLTNVLDKLLDEIFPEATENRRNGKCPFCGNEINQEEFKDELSRKEFAISGLCQSCQDSFFE